MKIWSLQEAELSYLQAIRFNSENYAAIEGLVGTLIQLNRPQEALEYCHKVLEKNPNNVNVRMAQTNCLNSLVPLWHTPMMNDHIRNKAYRDALQAAVKTDSHVLEIGTGSGLLAMMAAHCGAERVTTCEMSTSIAAVAKDIVSSNGMASTVEIISKQSTKLDVGAYLARPADILVSEVLSSEFLGEGVLDSIEDAKRRLLIPDGQVIPRSGSIRIALFGGDHIRQNIWVDKVSGFDLSNFNYITAKKVYVFANMYDIKLLSEETSAFTFDFSGDSSFPPDNCVIEIPVRTAGKCYGIIQWNQLHMDENIIFENHPYEKTMASAWKHVLYIFDKPIVLKVGQIAVISAAHNRSVPWFFLKEIQEATNTNG